MPNISIIAARSENFAIGYKQSLPWHCPADMQYFKTVTTGHTCVCGYNTYLTLPPRGLPNRNLFVLTSKNISDTPSVHFIKTLDDFFAETSAIEDEIFCIGGLSIFKLFLPYTTQIYLTEIHGSYKGDRFFTNDLLENFEKRLIKKDTSCTFYLYERRH